MVPSSSKVISLIMQSDINCAICSDVPPCPEVKRRRKLEGRSVKYLGIALNNRSCSTGFTFCSPSMMIHIGPMSASPLVADTIRSRNWRSTSALARDASALIFAAIASRMF